MLSISELSLEESKRRSQIAESIAANQSQIARQQEQIRHIMTENEQLKKDIATISGGQYDYVTADKLATLKNEVDSIERRYQFEKMRKNDLTKKYQLARIDLMHSRRLKGGVNAEKDHAKAVQTQVQILENRLDQALGQFNDALSYNKELRDQIDIIREERRVFQRIHKKMDNELGQKKRDMADRIEQSNRDMDERDQYLAQVEQLKQALAQQDEQYAAQIEELDGAMGEIKFMREEQMSLQLDLESREYELQNAADDSQANAAAAGGPSESMFRRVRLEDGGDGESEENGGGAMSVMSVPNERETNLTDVLNTIREYTGDDDIHKVTLEYQKLGESNFSLYKYINEVTAEKEQLETEIRQLRNAIGEESGAEAQHRGIIKALEEKLAAVESQLEKVVVTVDQHKEALQLIRGAAEDFYTHVMTRSKLSLGKASDAEQLSLMALLGKIEEAATRILFAYGRRDRRAARRIAAETRQLVEKHSSADKTNTDDEEEEEENALSGNADSPKLNSEGRRSSFSEDPVDDYEIAPLVPPPMVNTKRGVGARHYVKKLGLPSASLGGGEATELMDEFNDDQVISHDRIRKQVEQRLLAKREREERAQRKKREARDLLPISPRKGR